MEELDERIIDYLKINGYQNSSKISKELRTPTATTHRHLKKLIERDIISVIVHTNPVILGYKYWIRVGIDTKPALHGNILKYLVNHKSIYTVSEVANGFNILIGARFKSEEALFTFTNVDLPTLRGISKAEIFLITRPRKYYLFNWLIGSPTSSHKAQMFLDEKAHYELNEINRKILDIITTQGPKSATYLSKKLGIGAVRIQQYLRQMLDNQVFSSVVRVNPEYGGSELLATIGIIVSERPVCQVLEDIMVEEEYFATAGLCLGRFNIMLSAHFHDRESLSELINVKLRNIPGISSITTFIHTKRFKYYTSQY